MAGPTPRSSNYICVGSRAGTPQWFYAPSRLRPLGHRASNPLSCRGVHRFEPLLHRSQTPKKPLPLAPHHLSICVFEQLLPFMHKWKIIKGEALSFPTPRYWVEGQCQEKDGSLNTWYLHLTLPTNTLFEMCTTNDVVYLLVEIYGILCLLFQNESYLKHLPHLPLWFSSISL